MTLFAIGTSGLAAANQGLTSTSNNIANTNTKGYNRERVVLEESAQSGVITKGSERIVDSFVQKTLNQAIEKESQFTSLSNKMGQVDSLFADSELGVSALVDDFYSSVSDLANAPSSSSARQAVISAANSMTSQFRSIGSQLDKQRNAVNLEVESSVKDINLITGKIAEMNEKVLSGKANSTILNQRDELVSQLSEKLGTQLIVQDGKSFNLTLPSGKSLVQGAESYELLTQESSADPSKTVVAYKNPNGVISELKDSDLKGGELGGTLAFRSEQLTDIQNEFGRIAVSVFASFNGVHRQGFDAEAQPGQDFFGVASPTVIENRNNAGTATATATFDNNNIDKLTAREYEIRVTNAATNEFRVTDSKGDVFTQSLNASNELVFDGVVIEIDNPASLVNADSFVIQPTRSVVAQAEVLIDETQKLAAGTTVAPGDNRNALALQGLQEQDIVAGKSSFTDAYASLIGKVGSETAVADINKGIQGSVRDQAYQNQQSISGVNLDEEAANLVRYQQFYQASARVIDAATTIFDTVLGLKG